MLKFTDQGSGPAIVMIHGFPLCRQMWRPQQEALVSVGYRVICPDLPGFGDSPVMEDPPSMIGYADALIGLVDDLGIEKAVFAGMSMGGYVLFSLVDRYPERMLGAMFLVTRAAADDPEGKVKRTILAAEVKSGNRMIVPETFAKVLFAPDTPQRLPEVVSDVRRWMERTSAEGLAGGLLAMRDRDDYLAKLAGFALPSLVVGAEQDVAIPAEHSRTLARQLPDAELKIIPGAGHMVNLEQPALFNDVLIGFLQRLKL
jgi:3-oxoadipate enol-lactonase